ncbi:MAG: hypothetical protein E2590_04840 [Chryseobacterium sp.]|nr:hypothetical protein [Chryseobacterium sp.]
MFYTNSNSSITLCAHNRTVTREPLYNYIPEFKEDFVDEKFGNYVIKAYVIGEYLDSNVNNERNKFIFPKSSSEKKDYFLFSQDEIEYKVSNIIKDIFGEEVTTRKSAKKEKIINYINTKAPHHKNQINDIDFDKIMY